MRVLQLAQARVLLWARDPAGGEPFEVSKVVHHPLQPACSSAPRCPDEVEGEGAFQVRQPLWIDPGEAPAGACAYAFGLRGECLRHRNQVALESALFGPREVRLTQRLLEAMGYRVEEEAVDPAEDPPRILKAHGHVGRDHELRLLQSPAAGPIVLIREQPSVGEGDARAPRGSARGHARGRR